MTAPVRDRSVISSQPNEYSHYSATLHDPFAVREDDAASVGYSIHLSAALRSDIHEQEGSVKDDDGDVSPDGSKLSNVFYPGRLHSILTSTAETLGIEVEAEETFSPSLFYGHLGIRREGSSPLLSLLQDMYRERDAIRGNKAWRSTPPPQTIE